MGQNPAKVGGNDRSIRGRGTSSVAPSVWNRSPSRAPLKTGKTGPRSLNQIRQNNIREDSPFILVKPKAYPVLAAKKVLKSYGIRSEPTSGVRASLAEGAEVHSVSQDAKIAGDIGSRIEFSATDFLIPIEAPPDTKAGTILYQVDLTPHAFGRTRMSGLANFFTRMDLKEMSFIFETMQPATTPGAVAMVIIQDPDTTLPDDVNILREVATNSTFIQVSVWMDGICHVKLLDRDDPKYTALLNTDPRVSQFGRFYVIAASDLNSGGSADLGMGNVYFGYKMTFQDPLLSLTPIGGSYAEFTPTSAIGANSNHPFGNSTYMPNGNMDVSMILTTSGNTFTLAPGFYHVSWLVASSAAFDLTLNQTLGASVEEINDSFHKTSFIDDAGWTDNSTSAVRYGMSKDTWFKVVGGPSSSRTIAYYFTVNSGAYTAVFATGTDFNYYPFIRFTAISNDIPESTYYQSSTSISKELNVLKQQVNSLLQNSPF